MMQTFHLTGKVHIHINRTRTFTPSTVVLHVDTYYQYARLWMDDHIAQQHGRKSTHVELWFLNKEDLQVWANALQQAVEIIGQEEMR